MWGKILYVVLFLSRTKILRLGKKHFFSFGEEKKPPGKKYPEVQKKQACIEVGVCC